MGSDNWYREQRRCDEPRRREVPVEVPDDVDVAIAIPDLHEGPGPLGHLLAANVQQGQDAPEVLASQLLERPGIPDDGGGKFDSIHDPVDVSGCLNHLLMEIF